MKRVMWVVLMLAATLSCSGRKEVVSNEESVRQAEKELRQLELKLLTAIQRKDMETLSRIWADDYLGTAPNGIVVNKYDLMTAVKEGAIVLESLDLDDLRVRLFDDVAVMTGHAHVKGRVDNEDYSGSYRGTGIFIKRDGRWQAIGVHVGPDKKCPQ
ncbi:MAG TPA: nuclear transport factor 2 family protein [Pyrinomonadaceae bacterium]|nr:nuclear transport factor 2 family protein [Pyrinomonadaceae bacterium]